MPWLTSEGSCLSQLLFLAVFAWLCLAIGRRVLHMLGATGEAERGEIGLLAACLGAGALELVPLALGSVGAFQPQTLRIVVLAVLALALPDMLRVAAALYSAIKRPHIPRSFATLGALVLLPAALMALVIALSPSLDPDGLAYHLTVPKRWLQHGGFSYLPTYPYSNAPMGMEMLFSIGLVFAGDSAAKCIHWGLGLLAAFAIYRTGRRLNSQVAGIAVAALFLAGPAGIAVILGYSYVEGGAALATQTSVLSWLIWRQSGRDGYLRCAMLLAGIAVTFKISAALFPIGLLAITTIELYKADRLTPAYARKVLARVTGLGLWVCLPMVPWLTRSYLATGNPIFPVLATKIPSRDYSAELAAKVDAYNRYMTWGNALGREWSLQQRQLVLASVAAVWLVICAVGYFRSRSGLGRTTALVIGLGGVAQLSAVGLYLRYSLPLLGVVLLPGATLLNNLWNRRAVAIGVLVCALAGALVQVRRMHLDESSSFAARARTLVGAQDRRTFLRDTLPLYPLYERANRDLPPDAGIMLSGYCGGFYIDRSTYCAEMVQDSLRFNSWEEFTADLASLHITHIIAPSALATHGPTPYLGGSSVSVITRAQQYTVVRRLLEGHARELLLASDQGLYEILPSAFAAR